MDLLTPEETAAILRVQVGTLYSWKSRGMGPPNLKVCGALRYRRRDLAGWLDAQAAAS